LDTLAEEEDSDMGELNGANNVDTNLPTDVTMTEEGTENP